MRQNNDLLSADSSPQKLQTTGVKRVNNLPLFIAIGILTVFILLIAFVAQKRANLQHQVIEPAKLRTPKKNIMSLAYEVISNHKPGMIAHPTLANVPEPTPPVPMLKNMTQKQDLEIQEKTDAEMERIRQEKTQAFEEAVNAKTSIIVDNSRLNTREITKASMVSHGNSIQADATLTFKERLQLLQGRQNAKPMPQTLGAEENASRWHLRLESPNSRFELSAGSVISGVMVSGISSELPGQIIGQVSQNVYDTATGKYLLIPQGTKLIGIYSHDVSFGQNSVLAVWQRLVFPNGKALNIGSMPGADSAGYAGFRDQVDHHYARIYGSALLMSGIVAGITYSQNTNQGNPYGYSQPTAGSILSQALGQQLSEVTAQLVSKNLNVSPTINVRQVTASMSLS